MHKIANWNGSREAWENWDGEIDLFSTHSDVFLETWPSSGMTRSGVAYELPMPVLPTIGSACLSLPTPLASDGEKGGPNQRGAKGDLRLSSAVQMTLLKTPTSQLAINGGSQHPDKRKAGGHGLTLSDEVEHLLPTPTAIVANDGEGTETWLARRERVKARGINGNGMGMPLTIAVQLLPTPTVQDASNTGGPSQFNRNTKPLNTEVLLIGARTPPRSNAGKP
jgi:hypothetical protein